MSIQGSGTAQTSVTDTADSVGFISQDASVIASIPSIIQSSSRAQTITLQEIAALSVTQPGAVLKVTVTPELAKTILETINTDNRRISVARVKQYADVLRRGQYVFNGESIQIGIDSANRLILLNGQHRLSGCVEAGIEFESVIVLGLPTDVFSTIDRGKTRSYSDVLSVAGYKNTHNVQPAARVLVALEAGISPTSRSNMHLVTAEDVLQFVHDNDALLQDAHSVASRITSVAGGISSAWIIFIVRAVKQRMHAGHSGAEVFRFCEEIELGAGLTIGHPSLALRQWLGRGGSKRKGASGRNTLEAATFINVFNKWIEGGSLQIVRPFAMDNDFPSVSTAASRR